MKSIIKQLAHFYVRQHRKPLLAMIGAAFIWIAVVIALVTAGLPVWVVISLYALYTIVTTGLFKYGLKLEANIHNQEHLANLARKLESGEITEDAYKWNVFCHDTMTLTPEQFNQKYKTLPL